MAHHRFLRAPVLAALVIGLGLGVAPGQAGAASAEPGTTVEIASLVIDGEDLGSGNADAVAEAADAETAVSPDSRPAPPSVSAAEGEVEEVADANISLPPVVTVQPTVLFVPPTCAAPGSYTLVADDQVVWFVDGVETSPNTYPAATGRSVMVEATPFLGAFAPEVRTEWAFTFVAASLCDIDAGGSTDSPGQDSPPITETPAPVTSAPANPIPAAPVAAAPVGRGDATDAVASPRRDVSSLGESPSDFGQLPTLAFSGASELMSVIGSLGFLLLLSGIALVGARRPASR